MSERSHRSLAGPLLALRRSLARQLGSGEVRGGATPAHRLRARTSRSASRAAHRPCGFLGQEQISVAQVRRAEALNRANRGHGSGRHGRHAAARRPSHEPCACGRFVADQQMLMAVIGRSGEPGGEVSSGNLFEKAGLASISGSATAVDLTKGRPRSRRSSGIVPNDGIQAPQIVGVRAREPEGEERRRHRLAGRLLASALPSAVVARARRGTSTSQRESVIGGRHRLLVASCANVGNDIDVVVFATQVAPAANTLSAAASRAGARRRSSSERTARTRRSQFKPRTGYVSVFAPDIALRSESLRASSASTTGARRTSRSAPRPGDVHGRPRRDERDQKACADGRRRGPRCTRFVRPDEHPVDLRRDGQVLRGSGRPICRTRFA